MIKIWEPDYGNQVTNNWEKINNNLFIAMSLMEHT
jgi:hypothetical protein